MNVRKMWLAAVTALVIADLTKGTGRFNAMQGTIQACLGAGAFLSTFASGFIVSRFGFASGFLFLAGIAAIGLVFFSRCMPETRQRDTSGQGQHSPAQRPPASSRRAADPAP